MFTCTTNVRCAHCLWHKGWQTRKYVARGPFIFSLSLFHSLDHSHSPYFVNPSDDDCNAQGVKNQQILAKHINRRRETWTSNKDHYAAVISSEEMFSFTFLNRWSIIYVDSCVFIRNDRAEVWIHNVVQPSKLRCLLNRFISNLQYKIQENREYVVLKVENVPKQQQQSPKSPSNINR